MTEQSVALWITIRVAPTYYRRVAPALRLLWRPAIRAATHRLTETQNPAITGGVLFYRITGTWPNMTEQSVALWMTFRVAPTRYRRVAPVRLFNTRDAAIRFS
jgi:hypothetical protein